MCCLPHQTHLHFLFLSSFIHFFSYSTMKLINQQRGMKWGWLGWKLITHYSGFWILWIQWRRQPTQSTSFHLLIEKKKESKLLIWWNQINIIKVTKWKKIMKFLNFFIWFHWAAAGRQRESSKLHFIQFISLWEWEMKEWNWIVCLRGSLRSFINQPTNSNKNDFYLIGVDCEWLAAPNRSSAHSSLHQIK